ncbi:MAG TPA: protein kinase [Kofleriaceae bacterium]|nr:protein kinase [Kofleriaceae bacterium]
MLALVFIAANVTELVVDVPAPRDTAALAAQQQGGTASYGVLRTKQSGIPLWRNEGCINVIYNSTSVSIDEARALDAAFAAWSDAGLACGRIAVTSSRTGNPPSSIDGRNTVHIRRDRWCKPNDSVGPEHCYPHEVSAITRLVFVDDPADPDDGKITEFDMELNAVDFVLLAPNATAPMTTKTVLDLQAVATHEAGHALGLAHDCGTGAEPWPMDHAGNAVPACDAASPAVRAATMFYAVGANDLGPRTVEPAEVTGMCEVAKDLTCEEVVEGGCSAGGSPGLLVLIVLAAAGGGMRSRRRPGVTGSRYHRAFLMDAPIPQRIQRFQIHALIGRGGMGSVYRARDPQLERDVAIKVLSDSNRSMTQQLSADDTLDLREDGPATADELLREARMMAQLSHPNVLPVYEVGLHDGSVFVVMEHIDGSDLADWLLKPRSTAEILTVFTQAAHGLAAAHARGIVHRDFKPANVLVGADGRARVADFGLSRMNAPASAMVRVDDGRGTPRYMAPELWRGETASLKSDVYAFCAALDDALGGEQDERADARDKRWREKSLSPKLREVLAAGLSERPSARPELPQIVIALGGPAHRGRWLLLGGAGGAAAAAAIAFVVLAPARKSTPPPCEIASPAVFPVPPAFWTDFEQKRSALSSAITTTCKAFHDGELTAGQVEVRAHCYQRRDIELQTLAHLLIVDPSSVGDQGAIMQQFANPLQCEQIDETFIVDVTKLRALYTRYFHSFGLATPEKSKQHEELLIDLAQEAAATGERHLQGRVLSELGYELRYQDRLKEADAAWKEAGQIGTLIHAPSLTVFSYVERSFTASLANDDKSATAYAEMAQGLAAKSGPLINANVLHAIGRARNKAADYKQGGELLREAFAAIQQVPPPGDPLLELNIRSALCEALEMSHQAEASVKLAKETVEWAKKNFNERSDSYGGAVESLAAAQQAAGDREAALVTRLQALEIMKLTNPPTSARIALEHLTVSSDLMELGRFEEARREIQTAVDITEHNERARKELPWMLGSLASATWDAGDHEGGLKIAQRALNETIVLRGGDSASTQDARLRVTDMLFELGRLDAAEKQLVMFEESLRRSGKDLILARLQMAFRVELLNRSGKGKDAEKLARELQTTINELGAVEGDMYAFHAHIADALRVQKRYEEAHAEALQALEMAKKMKMRADYIALDEVRLARIEDKSGKHEQAVARAKSVLELFKTYRGQPLAQREAQKILAQ